MSFHVNAQTLTRELLKGNKWIYVNNSSVTSDYYRVFDDNYVYDSHHIHYTHPGRGTKIDTTIVITYAYYLSDTIPDKFEYAKVGKIPKGKYIIEHNESSKYVDADDATIYKVTKITENEMVLTHVKNTFEVIGMPGGSDTYRKE
ncbi:MAG: hypothetical protein II947_00670 [Bacteroidaceae bacterium]|nr:hypothetical protein [Bacteroidaceae bacterium]